MRLHSCTLADIRGRLAEVLGIRRERLRAPRTCPSDCCGHGHIYCMDYEGAPALRETQYNPDSDLTLAAAEDA